MKKTLLFALLTLMLPIVANAYDFSVDGIYYSINSDGTSVSVTYKTTSYNSYSGSVVIPSTVAYGDKTYSVTSIGNSAFSGCSGLTSITISNSVTSIGIYAFYKCSGLTSVTIPNSVTSIEYEVFDGCSRLTSITIPNSVTSIGNRAFSGCSGLTSITIPNSVTSIGSEAFYNCSRLTSITIPNSVTSIGNYAFDYTAWFNNQPVGLVYAGKVAYKYNGTMATGTKITLEEGTLGIAVGAFSKCTGLTSITIPNSVTSISSSTFYNCSGLTSVTIPNSVTSIGSEAFNNCSGLTSINIPNSVTSIGAWAFEGCSGLTSVSIPNSMTSIGSSAFYNCSRLTSVTINANDIVSKTSYSSNLGTIFGTQVKEYVLGDDVTSIGDCAFYDFSGLTSITIPNSVTSIGNSAFHGCSGLTSVTIPNSVTSIGNSAFSGCSGLTSIDIPNSVTTIEYETFNGCSILTSVTIPNSVTSIGSRSFYGCSGLTSVTIGNSVTSIGDWAFKGCSGLTSITIPNSVTSIEDSAFSGCSGLTSVTLNANDIVSKTSYSSNLGTIFGNQVKEYVLGDDVKGIGNYAFNKCSGLTSVTIGNSVTSIGDWAFYNCTGLTSVTIGSSVTSIGSSAFSGCCSLTSVTIPNSVTSIGYYAFDGTAWYNNQPDGLVYAGMIAYKYKGTMATVTKITLEEGTLGIGGGAFRGCSGLTSITIPNSVTSIGDYAFEGCSGLTSITIPNSVTSIGSYAFKECPLQTIVNHGNKDVKKDTFYDRVYLHTQLYVPEGTVWDYIFNTGWGEFHHIKEFASKADDIRNDAVYMIADRSGRNFPVYDKATKSLKNVAYTMNIDDDDTGACWQVKKNGSDTYLYNIGAGMYASYDVDNNLALSIVPTAVNIDVTEDGATINGRPVMLVANKSVTPVGPEYILGDANGNGEVEIGDVTSVLTLMATPEATGYNNKAADANGNGEIEIGDVTTILTIMASGD